MRRRDLITVLGGAAVTWPLVARAQQPNRVWRIAYLSATESADDPQAQSRRLIMEVALARLGYVEGKNLVIESRLLSDHVEQVNEAAAELLAQRPDVIVAVGTPDVAAALSVTKTIPIVFVNPADPSFAAARACKPVDAARSAPILHPLYRLHSEAGLADTSLEWFQSTASCGSVLGSQQDRITSD